MGLLRLIQGNYNTALGYQSGTAMNGSESNNTLIGYRSGYVMDGASNGNDNTFIGSSSGLAVSTGSNNTSVGKASAGTLTTGQFNTVIGWGTDVDLNAQYNQTVIGNQSVFKFLSKSYACDFCKNDDGDTASSENVPLKLPAYSIIKSISVIITQLSDLAEYDVSLVHSSTSGGVSDDAAPSGTPIELLGAGASDTMSGSSTSAVDINLAEAGEDGILKQTYYNDFGGDGLSVGTSDRYIHVVNADGNGDSNPSTAGYIAVLIEYIGQD